MRIQTTFLIPGQLETYTLECECTQFQYTCAKCHWVHEVKEDSIDVDMREIYYHSEAHKSKNK
jgi:hypothetical protein